MRYLTRSFLKYTYLITHLTLLSGVISFPIVGGPVASATERKQTADASVAWNDCRRVCQASKYDDFFSGPDGKERFEKAKQISGILEELEAHRQNFIRTGNFVDLFPTVYYQITKIELDSIMSGQMANPTQKMDMMMRFYDAYDNNRQAFERGGAAAVESHWQEYYNEAQAANGLLEKTGPIDQLRVANGVRTVLNQGIRAHVKFDLPRAIRSVTATNENVIPQMREDFEKSDPFFARANDAANADIINGLFPGSTAAKLGAPVVGSGISSGVIEKRHDAWNIATDGERLPTQSASQPTYDHRSSSTRYFPEELKSRGLCVTLTYQPSFTIYTRYDTKTKVCRNDSIEMRASGKISFGDWAGYAGPDGFPYPSFTAFNYDDMKRYNHGALVVFLLQGDTSQALGQGASWTRTMSADGSLYLVVNDKEPENNDGGPFNVEFHIEGHRLFGLDQMW